MAALALPPASLDQPVPPVRPASSVPLVPPIAAEPAEAKPVRPRLRRLVVFTGKLN